MLKIQFKDNRQAPFWVVEKALSIGHAEKNHLAIRDPSVSLQHAKILNQGEAFLLKDLGSKKGTFVNGQRINQKHIACGDVIRIGTVELEIIDPFAQSEGEPQSTWSLIADSSWLAGQEFPIKADINEVFTVGRGTQSDMVFPGTHLSRQHVEIRVNQASLTVKDLGSANGTFVNDRQVHQTDIVPGDRLRLDVYSFRVFGPGMPLPKSATAVHRAISEADVAKAVSSGDKQWKNKPTSPGNREQINLYQKNNTPLFMAGLVLAGLIGAAVYTALSIWGV